MHCWRVFDHLSDERDDDLSSCIRDLDFRYVHRFYFPELADWLYRQDPSDPIVRTEPSNEWDMRLLEYLGTVTNQGYADPAKFPWKWGNVECREYAFIGHEEKTTIILITRNRDRHYVYTLNLDKEPSLQQIIEHQDLLVNANWNKAPDREGEKLSMESGTNNPLAILDHLYTQILTDVPEESLPATQKILAYLVCMDQIGLSGRPVQVLCNFLRIDKSAFYSTFQNLDSLISLPAPEDASKVPLRFRHASFQDFLLDRNRSGRFAIEEKRAWVVIAKAALFWHSIDVTHFHTNDEWDFDEEHRHASLPYLEWVSPDDESAVSKGVADIAMRCWNVFDHLSDERDEDLSSCIRDLDFRYVYRLYPCRLADWLYKQDPSDSINGDWPKTCRSSEISLGRVAQPKWQTQVIFFRWT
ncbi:hypothetical protein P691DRAFT_438123 [Macrolepiota fuliginosa MF-IS2]|uniref:Uncharacterized protein n=1 Tax=Macrolepiota fuliginosa MF-IS2 TaxID=1400762 RepID=A0A9P6BYY4_9AGAR|nr:hypothetical protein P691DRAFT_438123 [Macrolepiota fuliginosa MF-IS2]